MFIPGETISHQFVLPFYRDDVDRITISYRQNGRLTLIKTVNQGQMSNTAKGSQFTIILTQEESLLFDNNTDFYVQLNVKFFSGARGASLEMRGNNGKQHIREVVN